jgi:hypothetical protein
MVHGGYDERRFMQWTISCWEAIKERADANGERINAMMKKRREKSRGRNGYRRFLGLWTEEESSAFNKAMRTLSLSLTVIGIHEDPRGRGADDRF